MTAKRVFTISPALPFADTLAAELLRQNRSDPAELARTVLFLPTRRACKTVQEAFLRQSGGKPLMLPRLIPFSAIEKPETQALLGLPAADLPDAIAPLRRRLLLAKLIKRRDGTLSAQKALDLADALAAFLDEVYIESMPFDRLKDIVPVELAAHWQETLTFLEIVTDVWQNILAEERVIDAADRQVRLFSALARHWRENPPEYPVVAAGSTGSRPATADLLDAIASAENGKVVLPGLDTLSDDESFAAVEPSHPQYNLKRLLERMGVNRRDVLPFGAKTAERTERLRLISEAMRPAATTDGWRTAPKFEPDVLNGVRRIDCADEREEALVIALILRQTLETPEKTAALITPDRFLARRVVAEMNRWGIEMDDSAGTNLTLTPTGTFLLLLGQTALSNAAPADLLACLKHPTALGGKSFAPFRSTVRELERRLLRGRRPGNGLAGLLTAAENDENGSARLVPFVTGLIDRIGDFIDLMSGGAPLPFGEMLDVHLTAAERLAQSADKTGAERLWSGDAGDAAADFLTQIKEQADLIGDIAPAEYLPLLYALFKGVTVRPKYGTHPRLDILGTMEARLIQPDVMILGGLNEGVWPQTPEVDPWLSRPMREKCGLPPPERKIALSAHDFAQAFCAENLIMTRAVKSGGTPGVPSRWLSRLQTVLGISGLKFDGGDERDWAREIDKPAASLSFLPPKPTPPASARPRRLSVTRIETLMRDPYGIYARYVLGLKKLKDVDEPFSAADFGTIAHKVVEVFCERHANGVPPDNAEDEILAVADEQIDALGYARTDATFWKPRLRSVLIWFVKRMRESGDIKKIHCERDGKLRFETKGGEFALTGCADRIDLLKDGSARIVDYKTGAPPSEKSVVAGYAPQLPLEAAIYKYGEFDGVPRADVGTLEYWRLIGRKEGGTVRRLKADARELADDALNRLKDLINAYDDESTPYYATPDTSLSLKYNDYEHLARFDEWATAARDDDDDGDDTEDDNG